MLNCPQCQFVNPLDATFCNRCGNHLQGVRDPLIDRIVNKYRIRERIGGGGFGSVYRAEHIELSHSFAIKILHPHLIHNELMVERFRREAQLLASLRHPNIVQVVDFGQIDGLGLYLAMEWLEGKTLQWHLKHEGCPPDDILKQIFEQLLDALSYAHQRGIVHRDLKPDNLIWIPGSRHRRTIKVLDFGIARMLEKQGSSRLTESGLAVGTPRYMSPEQAAGEVDRIDHRTDIYACGVLLMEILTGKPIFTGTTNEILLHQMETPPPRLSDLAPDSRFPPALDWVLQRALAKNPAQRYDSADAFAEALFSVLEGEQTQIVRPEEVRPVSLLRAAPPRTGGPGFVEDKPDKPASSPQTPVPFASRQSKPAVSSAPHAASPVLPHRDAMSSTRAITPVPLVPPPTFAPPVALSGQSGVYRGEKQSGQHTGQRTAPSTPQPQVQVSNNWMWGAIGLIGGVGVALLFYIFGSLDSQPNKSPRSLRGKPPEVESQTSGSSLPVPPSLRDAESDSLPKLPELPRQRDSLSSQNTSIHPENREPDQREPSVPTVLHRQDPSQPEDRPRPVSPVPLPNTRLPEVNEPDDSQRPLPRTVRVRRRWKPRRDVSRVPPRRPVLRRPVLPPVVRKSTTVAITLRSNPGGATVWVDSVVRGVTPITIRIQAGQMVRIRIKKDGYLGQNFSWKATADTTRSVTLAENIFR